MTNNVLHTQMYHSPCGEILLGAIDGMLCLCRWVDTAGFDKDMEDMLNCAGAHEIRVGDNITDRAKSQLDEYFKQQRQDFDLPLLFVAGTEFQRRVWNILRRIRYGTTVTYAAIAAQTGNVRAVRAVANALHKNPLPVIVPCHRVTGSNGKLTGYAGGLIAKRFLLNLEASHQELF